MTAGGEVGGVGGIVVKEPRHVFGSNGAKLGDFHGIEICPLLLLPLFFRLQRHEMVSMIDL